jgi:hypothetical protein
MALAEVALPVHFTVMEVMGGMTAAALTYMRVEAVLVGGLVVLLVRMAAAAVALVTRVLQVVAAAAPQGQDLLQLVAAVWVFPVYRG